MKKTRNELFDTERAKKELESELISLSNRGSRAGEINEGIDGLKLNFDKQMKILKKQLESKDIRLREKEEEFKKLEEEYSEAQLQIKKLDFSKSRSSYAFEALTDENLKQKNEELELKLLNKEEEYMDRIETLQKEIEALKMQAISGQTNMKPSIKGNAGDEMEVAALSVENQKLRKALKDLQNKGGSNSARGGMMEDNVLLRENEMLRKKNKEIEFERQKAADELINLKVL